MFYYYNMLPGHTSKRRSYMADILQDCYSRTCFYNHYSHILKKNKQQQTNNNTKNTHKKTNTNQHHHHLKNNNKNQQPKKNQNNNKQRNKFNYLYNYKSRNQTSIKKKKWGKAKIPFK